MDRRGEKEGKKDLQVRLRNICSKKFFFLKLNALFIGYEKHIRLNLQQAYFEAILHNDINSIEKLV